MHERAIYAVSWASEECGGLIATASGDDSIGLLCATLGGSTLSAADGGGADGGGADGGGAGQSSLVPLGVRPDAHAGDINSVSWRPTRAEAAGTDRAGWLASCGDDGCVRLWHTT